MEKQDIKKAYQAAEKDLKQKQIDEVKKVVLKTLEKLEVKKKAKAATEREIKSLRMDLDDLKEGRLDRMEERQKKDPEASKTSVITIIKEKEVIREVPSPWYWPYRIVWQYPTISPWDTGWATATGNFSSSDCGFASSGSIGMCTSDSTCGSNTIAITGSIAKNYATGAYDVDGCDHIVNFR